MSYKIFMCCHKPPEHTLKICTPIQCGSALNFQIPNIIHDNDGDNISSKNREYCELTAHYYSWKNVKADYYGFCHYRRFFYFNDTIKQPYLVKKNLKHINEEFLGSTKKLEEILAYYDVIVPRSENMGITAEEHYRTSKFHHLCDLELFMQILSEHKPRLLPYAKLYMSQNKQYFCNMFIMSKNIFFDYCEMLFPLLEIFDDKKQLHGNFHSDRTDGYLGEIFTGIYIDYLRSNDVKIKEVPRLDVGCTASKRFLYTVLPPESKLRFLIKKTVKKFL